MAVRYYRMVPGDTTVNPITIPGTKRAYSCAQGSIINVPDFDFQTLSNAGWVETVGSNSGCDVGPTSGRPSSITVPVGFQYVDTTLNAVVTLAGVKTGWVNAVTGAIV